MSLGASLLEAARAAGITVAAAGGEPRRNFVRVQDRRLHYLDWGPVGAPLLLCLHGRFQTAHAWDFLALGFSDRYRVVCPDLRGHGDSDWAADRDYSVAANVGDLEGLTGALGIEQAVMVGLSAGGRCAIAYAARQPRRVKALILVEAGPEFAMTSSELVRNMGRGSEAGESLEAIVRAAMARNPRRSEASVRGSLVHSLRQVADDRWVWKFDPALRELPPPQSAATDAAHLWGDFKGLACPTLLVRGGKSEVIPAALFERMREELPAARAIEIAAAGHQVPGDQPRAFEEAVRTFLLEEASP